MARKNGNSLGRTLEAIDDALFAKAFQPLVNAAAPIASYANLAAALLVLLFGLYWFLTTGLFEQMFIKNHKQEWSAVTVIYIFTSMYWVASALWDDRRRRRSKGATATVNSSRMVYFWPRIMVLIYCAIVIIVQLGAQLAFGDEVTARWLFNLPPYYLAYIDLAVIVATSANYIVACEDAPPPRPVAWRHRGPLPVGAN